MNADDEKRVAARAAADLVQDGMTVGLGTGSTVAHLLVALARRSLDIRCVSTSPVTERAARELGLRTEEFGTVDAFDLTIDGADQVSPDFWLLKGGGAAHTREKIVAASAQRFVIIVDSSKTVDTLSLPVPLELMAFGLPSTVRRLGPVRLRDAPLSPDGGLIADLDIPLTDPTAAAARISGTPGVVEHGLFPPEMVSSVIVGRGSSVEILQPR
jgi:ribose 5-phosphate isomerase A